MLKIGIGPIVRYSPNAVHVQDPEFYFQIYSNQLRLNKPPIWNVPAPDSTIAAVEADHHSWMRSHLNPFFSKRSVVEAEPQIRSLINRLIRRLRECQANKQIVRMDAAYSALALDMIVLYAFGVDEENLLHADFNLVWKDAILGTLSVFTFLQMFPWLWPILNNMPVWLTERLDPGMGKFPTR